MRSNAVESRAARGGEGLALLRALFAGLLLLVLAGACGESSPGGVAAQAGVDETPDVDAVTETPVEQTTPESASAPATDTAESVTTDADAASEIVFSESVLPVLEDVCAKCHAPGAPGSTHFELASVRDARAAAPDIALAVQSEVMPPWPASDLSVPFLGDHSLTDQQQADVVAWATDGAPIDVEPDTAVVSSQPLAVIEDRDVVMTSANGAYQGSPEVLDDYRCLIFDPGITESGWILATHFEPDQVEVVHHAIVDLASADLRAQAEQRDSAEPGPGWTCYGGNGLFAGDGARMTGLAGWAPGAPPARQPEGFAIPVEVGDFVVVQIHYHYDDNAPADLSRMVFDLASPEQIEANGGTFEQLRSDLYLGAAEIPCVEGDTHPLCDRDAALARVELLYGSFNRQLAQGLTLRCGYQLDDFAEMNQGTAWSSCDLPVTNPGTIVSIAAHMHELGATFRMTLNPDRDDERILLDIPDWSFDWQFGYRPIEEIEIDSGDTIRVECSWGRERAPYEAVGYILWAEGTGDEMCYSSITTAPT